MSSPIHRYLFSPPPSPPRASHDGKHRQPQFTSLKSLLPVEFLGSPQLGGQGEFKPHSPRTPQQKDFTLDTAYPASLPTRGIATPDSFVLRVQDVEATPRSASPRRQIKSEKEHGIATPPTLPTNAIAQSSRPIPATLPRPLLRLLFLGSLLLSSICILIFVPSARLPSLRAASASRRLALASDGRAYLDVERPVTSWEEAKDRDYAPPQIKAAKMMRRVKEQASAVKQDAAPHPKASRPAPAARPLPSSHELLALQSYLLESTYNVLPASIDPQRPLDANIVLGYEADELALDELINERLDDVVVWYGGNGDQTPPHELLSLLSALHGESRKPTLLPVHARPDLELLLPILTRLDLPLERTPILVIGNTPIIADMSRLEEMRGSGQLSNMLAKIGWVAKEEKEGRVAKQWKPKVAKLGKKEKTEVERAIKEAERR